MNKERRQTDLRARPFFRDFSDDAVHGADGGEFARTNALFRWRALAYGIPALSFAAGDWNLVRVTRRGVDAADESCEVVCRHPSLHVILK